MPDMNDLLDDAFRIAEDMDFKLFFSLDYSGDGHWPQDRVVDTLHRYANRTGYYTGSDGLPLVTTFEGSQAAGDWANIKKKAPCAFIPDWSSIKPDVAIGRAAVDGLMSWQAWPNGTSEMTTQYDKEYMDALKGKPYIMPVSPWFYANMVRLHKNWVWQGDDLWYTRWQQVLEMDPEYVEIISWNDYGESHYVGPIHENGMDVFRYGESPFNYAKGMPHDGWRQFLPYIIDLYKNGGKNANIDEEGIVAWYRLSPANACGAGKTTGNTEAQSQDLAKPGDVLTDKIFFSALLDTPADISISIGGENRTGSWQHTPDGGKGIYHGNIPMDDQTGEVIVTLSRDKEFMAQIKGQAISDECPQNLTNWNAWVGNATSTAKRLKGSSSASGGDDASLSSHLVVTGLTQVLLGWAMFYLLL